MKTLVLLLAAALVQISLAGETEAGVNIGSGSEHRGPNLRRGFAPHSKPL
jgi:hypothetical protein